LLRVRGVSSASVSGNTPTNERRRAIEGFRKGEIHVLANCNVLTQGFDAPGVRALYIARPTFSPNAYIQMVGRGLRGPANGGKAECLIVNVADTFDEFGETLAFREFDYLWDLQGEAGR
jgi:superfamily II DNA or RNA helicase